MSSAAQKKLEEFRAKDAADSEKKRRFDTGTAVSVSGSTIWEQKAASRYGPVPAAASQMLRPNAMSTTAICSEQSNTVGSELTPRPLTSSIGVGGLSLHDGRNKFQGGGMRSVYATQAPSVHSKQSIELLNQRPTDLFHPKQAFEPGVVFSAVTHEHHYRQDRIEHDNANQTETNFGVTNSKFRKFVVLARFEHHVIALPILTHQGRGLGNKGHKNEYVSVRERPLEVSAAPAESKHGILWAELFPNFQHASPWHRMSDRCCLHIMKPFSHDMSHKCTISGKLEVASMIKLQKLFRDAVVDAASRGSVNRSEFQTPLASLEESPTTPRGHSFPAQQAPVTGAGHRPKNIWSSTRSNLSQSSISVC